MLKACIRRRKSVLFGLLVLLFLTGLALPTYGGMESGGIAHAQSQLVLNFPCPENNWVYITGTPAGHSGSSRFAWDMGCQDGWVAAVASGIVWERRGISTLNGQPCTNARCGDQLAIRGDDGLCYWYVHMNVNSYRVSQGQRVTKGTVVGRYVLGSGTANHLHFAVTRFNNGCPGTGPGVTHELRFTFAEVSGGIPRLNATYISRNALVAANRPPVAVNDSAQSNGQPIVIPVLNNDSDPDGNALAIEAIANPPTNGSAVINPDNTITYTPNFGFSGSDSFIYRISDGQGENATATVNVMVQLVCNPDPEADLSGILLRESQLGSGRITNNSTACSYQVGIASYEKFDAIIDNQILFDSNLITIGPGTSQEISVTLPNCAAQIDLFYGDLLPSLQGFRYGERLLDAIHIGNTNYCSPEPPAEEVDLDESEGEGPEAEETEEPDTSGETPVEDLIEESDDELLIEETTESP